MPTLTSLTAITFATISSAEKAIANPTSVIELPPHLLQLPEEHMSIMEASPLIAVVASEYHNINALEIEQVNCEAPDFCNGNLTCYQFL